MKWLINLAARFTGAKAAWDSLSGYRTYLGGTAGILTGVAALLTGVAGIEDVATLIKFVQGLASDPAWLLVVASWTAMGFRAKDEKKD